MSAAVPPPAAPPVAGPPAAVVGKVAYRRLPGRVPVLRFGMLVPGGSLHFGPDHLLKIDTGVVHETYKRFAFREMAAITLVRTARWHWITVFAVTMIAVIFVIALPARTLSGRGTEWALVCFGVPFLLLLVFNLLRGPTCRVTLHTAIGSEPLPTLGRVRVAVPVVREIAAAAERAQGVLSAEALAAHISTSLPPPPRPQW